VLRDPFYSDIIVLEFINQVTNTCVLRCLEVRYYVLLLIQFKTHFVFLRGNYYHWYRCDWVVQNSTMIPEKCVLRLYLYIISILLYRTSLGGSVFWFDIMNQNTYHILSATLMRLAQRLYNGSTHNLRLSTW